MKSPINGTVIWLLLADGQTLFFRTYLDKVECPRFLEKSKLCFGQKDVSNYGDFGAAVSYGCYLCTFVYIGCIIRTVLAHSAQNHPKSRKATGKKRVFVVHYYISSVIIF